MSDALESFPRFQMAPILPYETPAQAAAISFSLGPTLSTKEFKSDEAYLGAR
jgi:hypothetical protein